METSRDERVTPRTIDVLGLDVHVLTRPELLDLLDGWAARQAGPPKRMYYTNAHVFNVAAGDPDFRRSLNGADVLIFEGFGGCLGAQLLGHERPEQLATMDWMDDFLARLAARGGAIHLVGDEPGVAERCAGEMARRHPGLRIGGTHHGFFAKDGPESEAVVAAVNASGADVLMVGMGNPVQEAWIERHLDDLEVPVVFALGAMFRWYVEEEPRAPRWMRELHLEWLLRLVRHPVRHFRRYVLGNPRFLARVLRQRWAGTP